MSDSAGVSCVGVLGATSFVGSSVLSILDNNAFKVIAFSRQKIERPLDGGEWQQLVLSDVEKIKKIPLWICLAPIWVLPDYFNFLLASGVGRIVVLSSTSLFTKENSSDLGEQIIARKLVNAEKAIQAWASENNIEWVILRPTLIYGTGRDKNISEIMKFIQRFAFFPLLGKADGLRQPVHCDDVAKACVSVLKTADVVNRSYNISGGETLTYKEMVKRVFKFFDMPPRLFSVPLSLFKFVVMCLRFSPRYKHWSVAMAERMNCDQVFDHADATRDFSFEPRLFVLSDDNGYHKVYK